MWETFFKTLCVFNVIFVIQVDLQPLFGNEPISKLFGEIEIVWHSLPITGFMYCETML